MRRFLVLSVGPLVLAAPLAGQTHSHEHQHAAQVSDSLSAMATGVVTHTAPALAGNARTEALVTQPMLMARGAHFGDALRYAVMLNAEQWTMPDGEPVAGIWGEGFIDRRHPHTVVHEVVLTGVTSIAGRQFSLSGGKGIVPFGTDDPMVRPFSKYPANHHYAQILERLVLSAALRVASRASVELALFNGDEPTSSTAAPRWRRFGDSYAARATWWPTGDLEVQGSTAGVRSPEFASGDGLDQRKLSASSRWTPRQSALRYLLVEWARTEDRYRSRTLAGYGTGLIEAAGTYRRISLAVRAEQTSRPEEERLLDPFRTARPPSDLTIKGITRWRLLTAQLSAAMPSVGQGHGVVFVETARATSAPQLRPVLLDPRFVIGANSAWHLSAGIRLGLGAMPARVGRYGAAAGGPLTDAALSMPQH